MLATSYVNDAAHGGTLACVLINTADAARAVKLDVKGQPAPAGVTLSRTDRVNHHADVGAPAARRHHPAAAQERDDGGGEVTGMRNSEC